MAETKQQVFEALLDAWNNDEAFIIAEFTSGTTQTAKDLEKLSTATDTWMKRYREGF